MKRLLTYSWILFVFVTFNAYTQNLNFSGGSRSSVLLCKDGHVYVSGDNSFGQLGRGFLPSINSPDIVSGIGGAGTLMNIKQVAGKQTFSLIALSAGGDTVITWGRNNHGQLGNNLIDNGSNNNQYPYRVIGVNASGSLTGVKYVTMGTETAYAVLKNGKVVAWGNSNSGALGNGTTSPDMTSPVYVMKSPTDTLKNVVSMAAGDLFAVALLNDGTLWAWGQNYAGQLGQNNTTASSYAIQVKGRNGLGYLTNIVSISCSERHSLALSANDTTWAWGANNTGQLGNNTNTNSYAPVFVLNATGTAAMRNVKAIATGDGFSLALRMDSTLSVWGDNSAGKFGNNTTVSSLIPTKVLEPTGSGSLSSIVQISTGEIFCFAQKKNGVLLAWGDNSNGQLGMADNLQRYLPDTVITPCVWAMPPVFVKGTMGGTATVCSPANSGTVSISGNNGTVVAWQSSNNNFVNYVVTTSSSSSLSFSNLTQKTSYRAVIQFNGQIMYSDSLVVQVAQPTVGGTLSGQTTVCASANSGVLNLSGQLGAVISWESSVDSFATVGAVIANTTASYNYSNLTATQYFRANVQSGACAPAYSSIVKITVSPVTAGGTLNSGNPTNVCITANTGTISLTGQTGTISRWESSTDGFSTINTIVNTTDNYSYLNLTTTTQFRAVLRSGVCPVAYSSPLTISVDQATVAGSVTSPAIVCSGSNTGTLSLGTHTGLIVQWESSPDAFVSTSNVIANMSSLYSYTNLTSTTYFRVLLQNGSCPSAYSNNVKISVDDMTAPGTVGLPGTVCFGTNSGSMSLSGNNGAVIRWEYSSDNFSSFINTISNTTTNNSYSNLTVTTYYRAYVQNGVCPPAYSTVNIISVDPLSSGGSLTPSSTVVCSGSNSGTLTLSSEVGNVISWESSTDNFSTVITPVTNTATTQGYTNLTATTSYRAVIQSGVCPVVRSPAATVTVTPVSVGGTVTTSATICAGTSGAPLSLSGTTGTILRWESSTDGFTTINMIANTGTTYAYPPLTTTTQFRARVKNGICPGDYSIPATIGVDQLSVAGALGKDTTVCAASNNGILSLLGPTTGAIVRWQSSTDNFSTIITPITNIATTYSYNNLTATTGYRVQVKNGVCPSVFSNSVKISVDAVSSGGNLNSSASVCSGTNTGNLNLTGNNGNIVQWESSTDNFSAIPTPIGNTSTNYSYNNLTTTTYYRTLVKNGVCPAVYSTTATISVYPVSNGGALDGTDTVCYGFNSGSVTISLSSVTGNIVRWEKSTDNITYSVINSTANSQSYSNLVSTTYYRVLVQNGSCAPAYSSAVEITVNPNSVGGAVSGSDTVCISSNTGVLRLSGYLGTVVQWETSTDNFTFTNDAVSNTTDTIAYDDLTVTTYFRAKIQNTGCPITYPSPALVKVDPVSVAGTLTAPAVVCANANTGVIRLVGYSGTILQWDTSYNNFSTYSTVSNITDSIEYHNLPRTTFYRAKVKSGVCASAYSNVTAVTVNPSSAGGTIVGTKNVCIDENAGTLVLTGDTGVVLKWQTSLNNFITYTDLANTTHNFSYNNLSTPLSVRAEVQYSPCPAVFSEVFTFIVNPSTVAGMITGNTIVKKGENSGPLTLVNFTGGVLEWEYSEDTTAGWTSLPITSNVYEFTNVDTAIFVKVRVKSGSCNDAWSPVFQLQISTESNTAIKVYPTISPNADQINDEWIIDNISLYPSNQVKIFNRWGDVVYEARGYDNSSKVWRGQSNTHFTMLGQDLPEGTYFYIIDPGNGKPEFSGYVVLNR